MKFINSKPACLFGSILILAASSLFPDTWKGTWVAEGISSADWRGNENLGASIRGENGRLNLKPKDDAWARVVLASADSRFFWDDTGFTLRLTGEIRTLRQTDGSDISVFFGFTPDADPRTVQSGQCFVGLSVNQSETRGEVEVSLSLKEVPGEAVKRRGDDKGNLAYYSYPAVKIPMEKIGQPFHLTLRLSRSRLEAQIPEWGYRQAQDHGLTERFWKSGARFFLQAMNLGSGRGMVALHDVALDFPGVKEQSFSAVDLKAFANMGFKDEAEGDGKGGWTDQGKNDLSGLVPGPVRLSGLPFDIIDPSKNKGLSSLMLYSTHKTFFPKAIGPIPLAGKAHSLLFLHGAAWAKMGAEGGTYVVTYQDGTAEKIKVTVGEAVDDWWKMTPPKNGKAAVLLKVKSELSGSGMVGIYGFQWVNPRPEKSLESLKLVSAEGDVILGIIAVTRIDASADGATLAAVDLAFAPQASVDFRKDPPDKETYPERITVRSEKAIKPGSFSVAGYYRSAASSFDADPAAWADLVKSAGGVVRFPYGLEISFSFWPYEVKDWAPALSEKGGKYGTIQSWFHPWGDKSNMITIPQMLATAKAQGLKVILQFNCHSMFDGKDFIYVKTLPEEKMKRENPMDSGVFNEENMRRILARNADLVQFVIDKGYADTVAIWEMDNERWDMKGDEYARVVVEHLKMLRGRIPNAKTLVCMGDLSSYTPNPEGHFYLKWSQAVLDGIAKAGMAGAVDYFAPHVYPYLADTTNDITANYLGDWAIRNINRSLDTLAGMLDKSGFKDTRFFISEWGAQSDGVAGGSRNDLLVNMAGALATAKTMMAIYAHPRVEGGTFHPFIHDSYVSRPGKKPIQKWGGQSVFYFADEKKYVATPVLSVVSEFVAFCKDSVLLPNTLAVPPGVQVLAARDGAGVKYFAVNSTGKAVKMTLPVSSRKSLGSADPLAGIIVKYGSYGDAPGDLVTMPWHMGGDSVLPPYSVSVLR